MSNFAARYNWNGPRLALLILRSDVDRMVKLGLGLGLFLGLSLSTSGFLLSRNIMDSFAIFVQHSMIGVRGAVQLYFPQSPELMHQFLGSWHESEIPFSKSWDSGHALELELMISEEPWQGQARLQVVNSHYLASKMSSCPQTKANSVLMNRLFRLGLMESLSLPQQVTVSIPALKLQEYPMVLGECLAETGMMTDEPMLFIPWEALPAALISSDTLEFYTMSREAEQQLVEQIQQNFKTLPRQTGEQYLLKRLFADEKMKVADFISKQTTRISWGIAGISAVLVLVILLFGLLLLLDFKAVSLNTLRLCGGSLRELLLAISFVCLLLGIFAVVIGMVFTLGVRHVLELSQLLPTAGFLQPLDWKLLLAMLLGFPLLAAFTGIGSVIWFFRHQQQTI